MVGDCMRANNLGKHAGSHSLNWISHSYNAAAIAYLLYLRLPPVSQKENTSDPMRRCTETCKVRQIEDRCEIIGDGRIRVESDRSVRDLLSFPRLNFYQEQTCWQNTTCPGVWTRNTRLSFDLIQEGCSPISAILPGTAQTGSTTSPSIYSLTVTKSTDARSCGCRACPRWVCKTSCKCIFKDCEWRRGRSASRPPYQPQFNCITIDPEWLSPAQEENTAAAYLRIQGPSVQGFLLFMAKNKARFLFKTQWKSAILKRRWESRRGLLHYWPSSLVRKMLIIHIQACSDGGSDASEAAEERLCGSSPTCGASLEARRMSHGDRSLLQLLCDMSVEWGVSAKVAVVRAQRVWRNSERVERRASRWRLRGGASLRTPKQTPRPAPRPQRRRLLHKNIIRSNK